MKFLSAIALFLVLSVSAFGEPIAELHVMNYESDYGDGCCWQLWLDQWHGMPGNMMYVDAVMTTPGATITAVNGPSGAPAAVVQSATTARWYFAAPNGLVGGAIVTICFKNVPAGGVALTLTGYDSAGNTQLPLQQTTVTLAEWGDCDVMPDLWMRDTDAPDPVDTGIEPNTISPAFHISQDIWIRNNADAVVGANPGNDTPLPADRAYANEHQHQNPVYSGPGTNRYVYVKVRNRGTGASSASALRVYWADASTGLGWPGTGIWNEIDCVPGSGGIDPCPLPSIGAGKDYVAQLPWVPPNPAGFGGSRHVCLIARIETYSFPPYGMTVPEGAVLWQNVANNNNIVWKNVTVLGGATSSGKVIVRNVLDREAALTLRFAVPEREAKNPFTRHGEITIDLGEALMAKWKAAGGRMVGFEVTGPTTIRITDPLRAQLTGLPFRAGEQQTISVRMQLRRDAKLAPGTTFTFDVTQLASGAATGGERYVFTVPGRKVRGAASTR